MGLSPYSNAADAGILLMIVVQTAMWVTLIKDNLVSILHVVGISVGSLEEFPNEPPTESLESQRSPCPSRTYVDEFRSVTPTLRFDSLWTATEPHCSVCLVEFEPDAEINQLSCGHVFHNYCLEKWLNYLNLTCPLCRNHMIAMKETQGSICPM